MTCIVITDVTSIVALPPDTPKKKIHELMPQLRAEWAAMSQEERAQATKDRIDELTELRKAKANTPSNSTLSAFHDVGKNLSSVVDEVCFYFTLVHLLSLIDEASLPRSHAVPGCISCSWQSARVRTTSCGPSSIRRRTPWRITSTHSASSRCLNSCSSLNPSAWRDLEVSLLFKIR